MTIILIIAAILVIGFILKFLFGMAYVVQMNKMVQQEFLKGAHEDAQKVMQGDLPLVVWEVSYENNIPKDRYESLRGIILRNITQEEEK